MHTRILVSMTNHHLSEVPVTRTAVERRPRSRIGSRFARRTAAAVIVVAAALWSAADAQAQILFRETFGSADAQLPTATSTADGNWTNATCLNGQIVAGGAPSDDTGSTHFLLDFSHASDTGFPGCTYTAGQAVWRTVTPIPVQPNTTYVFSYWSSQRTAPSPAVLTQAVTPNAGAITVNYTSTPAWPAVNAWTYRSVTFTTGAATTSVNLRINNANTVGGGNDFGLDDIMLFQPPPFAGCTTTPYLAQAQSGGNSGLFQVNTTTNPFTYPAVGPDSGLLYNGIAFNPADNYIYGIEATTNTLVRVGSDGSVARLGAIANLPAPGPNSYPSGEIGSDGFFYVMLGGNTNLLYRINLSTRTAATPAITLSQTFQTFDLAWYNGLLYSAEGNQLRSINPANGVVTNIGAPFTGPTLFGAMMSASNGIFGAANGGGFYQFNPTTGAATLLSSSPASSGNDGAKCWSTPLTLPADLAITKTDNQATYMPGSNAVYTIVVSNSGPFGAAGASVTDPLPTGITTASWTCSPTAGGAACGAPSGTGAINTTANLPVGGSVTYTVTMAVPLNFTGNLINTATVTPSSATTESNTANNSATDTDTQFPACNLATNGSFERPNIQGDPNNPEPGTVYANGWAAFRTSQATLDGWQIVGGSVDILRYGVNASDGAQSIDLYGSAPPPTFQRTFTGLIPGRTYAFAIDYSGFETQAASSRISLDQGGAGFQPLATLRPVANAVANGNAGLPATPQYTVTWATFSYSFVATATEATIKFDQTTPSPNGAGLLIDNFRFGSQAPCEDYGDAPTSYGTLAADNGPRHGAAGYVAASNRASLILGDAISIDSNGKPGASAALDDYDDGLVAGSVALRAGTTTASATVRAVNTNASPATLAGWIDFNANGTFDAGERAEVTVPANTTAAAPFTLTWSGLPAVPGGTSTFARFRVATNAAEVVSPLGAANDGEVEDYMVTVLPAQADLAITKVGPASATVGTNVSYTLTVTNNGPSLATAVSVADPTPSGMTFVSNAGDCTTAFPCALGDLAPGATRTITTTFTVPIGFSTPSVTNTATVSTTTTDPVPGNNTASAVMSVDIGADVAVTKTVTPSSGVLVGSQVTFTVGASNNGPNTATGVVLTDVLPAGFTFVSATPSQGTYAQVTGAWSVGTLAVGAPPVTLQIVATVTQPGALTNTATKTAAQQPDPNTANDSAVASINAAPSADVGVTKTVDNVSPSVGNIVTFTVVAMNNGPSPVTNVVLTDLLPAGLTFQAATPSAGSYDSATGVWTLGNLAVGASATLTLSAQVTAAGPIVNTATRTSQTEADQNPANDQASVSLNAIPSADLQVTKGASNPAPAVGANVTYTVTVRNNGPSPATSVVVNDTLPAGLTFVSAVPSQGSYDSGTGVWTVGTLGGTQTATLSLTATVDGPVPATLTNTATGSGAEPDPFPGNNTGTSTITSQIIADLVITKTDGLTTVVPGQPVTYTIVVTNRGPSPVTDAPVSDTFPAALTGVTWTCAATAPSNCDTPSGAGPLNATVDLPAGGSATFTATGILAATTPAGTLSNTATVAAPAGATDSDPSNNSATETSTIVPTADVAITKSGPANAVAGTNVTYSLTVTNNGPSTATAVSVNDPAPSGLTFVSATAPCASGVTPCGLGDLAPGASVSFDVTFSVPGGYTAPDPIPNTATVSTTANDPAPGNNTATAQTALAAPVTDLGVTKSNGTTTVVPGTTTTYTLVVTNAGPSDAVNAPVTDTFDPAKVNVAGATWTCAATGSASCAVPGGTGNLSTTVSIAADPSGTTNFVTFTLTVPVRADATGSLVNTVAVGAGPGQSDPNSTNDTDTDTLTPQADLAITKSGPPTVTPGTTVSYTIVVTNNGPSNAEGVNVADPTPAGLTFVSNAGDCTTAFPCALGTLAPAATRTITATYQVPAGYTTPDPILNTASVSSGTPDTNATNNTSTASSTVGASADLHITKTAPPMIVPGTTASYIVTVVNNGPSVAQNVSVDDPTPSGLTLVGVDGPCASFPCTITSLGVGTPVSFTVRFAVPANYTTPNPIANTAAATSSTTDPDPSDNTVTTSTPLGPALADLSVDKSGPTTVAPGGSVTYTIVVRNAGPADVTDGLLTDVLPTGVTFGSVTAPPAGTCTGGQTISCTGLVVPVGGSLTLTVTGTVAADLEIGATLTNVATITSSTTTDPAPDNNRDEVDSRVGAATEADLAIVKTDAADPVVVGGTVTYTLGVTNYGPAVATNVTITDPLPAGLSLVSVSGACAALPCVVPSLAAGATTSLTVTATANTPGVVTNTATVSATEPDPVPANNTATEPTTIAATATDADLSMTKAGPARAGVGQTVLYTLTVTNRGPGAAANVQVDDAVPAGLTINSAAAEQGTCVIGGLITCSLGTIPGGSSVRITVLATVTTAGALTNSATATSSTSDPDPSNNTSTVTTEGGDPSAADLAIAKVDSPDAVVGGTPLQYVLTVTNRGPGVATGASVSDTLPAGMTALTATSTVGTCTPGATVSCALGDLAPGAIVTITIGTLAPVALPAPNPMVNTATVTSGAADPDPANNTATEPTTVVTRADLAIVKTTAQTSAAPGTTLSYTITVTNNGPSVADGVVVSDPTPVGLTLVSASAPCAGGFPCAIGTLAPGAAATVAVTYQVPPSYTAPDPIANTATVTSTTVDPDPGSNTSTVTTPLGAAQADLSVVKSGPANIQRGGQATYVLTVTNHGPADAAGVTLVDPTPAGLTFVNASAPCASGFPCTLGTLAFGASTSVTVTFQVPNDYSGPTTITNVGSVSSPTTDPDPTDNSSTVTSPLIEVADIQLTKVVDRTTPAVDEEVTFTIAARNSGPSPATGVAITDAMPAGLVLVLATPSQGTYDAASGLWTVGAIPNGATVTLQLRVRVVAGGVQTNTATKTGGDQLDPDPSNNSATSTLTGAPESDVQIAKTADVTNVAVGSPVTFTVTARNAGPSAATDVRIAENLSPGLALVSATPSVGTFDPATRVWSIDMLAANTSATLTVVANVTEAGAIQNTARKVGQREDDPNPKNDEGGFIVNGLSADLQVVKTMSAPPVVTIGTEVVFFVTASNNGPAAATGVRVKEQLPAGLAFVSATASKGVYVAPTGIWEVGTLDLAGAGATAVLEVHAVVTSTDPITNVASIMTSDQPDPNPLNNGGTVTLTAAALDLAVGLTTEDEPGLVGSTVTFVLSATNVSGVTSVDPITIAVPLPVEYTFVPTTVAGWECTLVERTVFCRTTSTVVPGQQITVPLRVHVDSALPWGSAMFAHLTSRPDTNPRNNVAQTYIGPPPHPDPDMSVTQSVVVSGTTGTTRTLTYTIDVTNQGPIAAEHAVLTDVLPAGLTLVSASLPSGPCTVSGSLITCPIGAMLPGHHMFGTFVFTASAPGVVIHTLSTSSEGHDMYPRDNQAMLLTTLAPPTDTDTDGDGMTDVWESLMGLSAMTNDANADPDGDGVSNIEEYRRGTHPRGFFKQYFAEGVSSDFFTTQFGALNLSATQSASVLFEFMVEGGQIVSAPYRFDAVARRTLDPFVLLGSTNHVYSAVIESDQPIAADRAVSWGTPSYGAHAEVGLPAPSSTWYFAEGATGPFALFFLLQNPNATAANVTMNFLMTSGAPIVQPVTVEPFSRYTVPVNTLPGLATGAMSTQITSDQPIVAERAMYFGPSFLGGTDGAGASALSTEWFFAEGATGGFFEEFILIANPGATPADITAVFARPDGQTVTRTYTVAPRSRYTILVDGVDPLLSATAVAVTLTSTNGVGVVAERAMYWPGGVWQEGHVSLGATTTGLAWAVPTGTAGGAQGAQTYVLIANASANPGTMQVTLVFDDGTRATKTIPLAPQARYTVDVRGEFPVAAGRTFSVIVESVGAAPVPIVVESARYWSTPDVFWAAGTSELATKVR
jgi:uncharacterized repeat protein (TIGR01451 family)